MSSNTKTAKSAEKRETKAALVERLLKARNGATIAQLVEATSWQPHTSRAFLTGLRKKGHNLIKDQRKDGTTSYCIRSLRPERGFCANGMARQSLSRFWKKALDMPTKPGARSAR